MSYEPTDMRKLINLFEKGPIRNQQEELLEETLMSLIDARYDAMALTNPELLVENWITDKVKNIGSRISAAIDSFKKDPTAPEVRDLDKDLISYNDEVKSRFSSVPTGKMRIVYFSDSYEDIRRIYSTGLKDTDVAELKHDTKTYPAAGGVELKYTKDFHIIMFQPSATFKRMNAYSGVTAARGGPGFKYAVVFNAPAKVWDIDPTKFSDSLKMFKPSNANDNAVGILHFAKGGAASFDKGILFPSLMTKEQILAKYKDELEANGIKVGDVKDGNDVFQPADSSAGGASGAADQSGGNQGAAPSNTSQVNNTTGQTLAVDIDDVTGTLDALKKIKKEIEDGTHVIDAKVLENIEKIKAHLDELITAAKKQQASNAKKSDFAQFEEAIKKDLSDRKNLEDAVKQAKHLLPFANHWSKDGGDHARIDIGKLKKGLDDLIGTHTGGAHKTTIDPDTRAIVNKLANDFDTWEGTK